MKKIFRKILLISLIVCTKTNIYSAAALGQAGDSDMTEEMVNRFSHEELTLYNKFGFTILHVAAESGYLDIIQCITEKNLATLNQKDNRGWTPLHIATGRNRFDIVQWIVEKDLSTLTQKNNYGETPLHVSIQLGQHNITQYIIEKNPTTLAQKDIHGWTPLHLVAAGGRFDIAKVIIEKDQTTLAQKDNRGRTPLHFAAQNGDVDIAKYIIERDPSLLEQKTNDGYTPLLLAAKYGRLNIINLLLHDPQSQTPRPIDFRSKIYTKENIINLAPTCIKRDIINLLKNHLLRLHEINPNQYLQCAICLNNATACPDCKNIDDPIERVHLLPCCLNVLCEHDFALVATSDAPTCPYCRKVLS